MVKFSEKKSVLENFRANVPKRWRRGLQEHEKGAKYQHMVCKERLECAMGSINQSISGTVAIVSAPFHTSA